MRPECGGSLDRQTQSSSLYVDPRRSNFRERDENILKSSSSVRIGREKRNFGGRRFAAPTATDRAKWIRFARRQRPAAAPAPARKRSAHSRTVAARITPLAARNGCVRPILTPEARSRQPPFHGTDNDWPREPDRVLRQPDTMDRKGAGVPR